jgi:hypothetical protein
MNSTNNEKICISVFFVTLSAGIAIPIMWGSLYPVTNIVFTSGIIAVIILSWVDDSLQRSYPVYLVVVIALAVAYRLRIFLFPASMIGIDPDGYALQIARVMETGSTSAITYDFYSRAPFHILEGATTGLITALPAPVASVVYPVASGVAVPLLAASFAGRLRPNSPRTTILAAGGVSVLGYSVHYSYWPIAQTTGVLFLLFTVFSIFAYASKGDYRWLALGLLTMLGAVYTHKLAAIATGLSVGGALILGYLHPSTRNTSAVKRLARGAVGLVGLLTAVQLFFVSDFARTVVFQLAVPSPSSPSSAMPTAAVDPYTLIDRVFQLSYVVILGVTSGLVWLGWLWRTIRKRHPRRDVLLLGFVAPLAGLFVVAPFAGINPIRSIFYSEALLVVVIAVGLYWAIVESPTPSRRVSRYVAIGVVLLLVVTAGTSTMAGPDYESLNRNYLTTEEVTAKEWGYEMVPNEIATDQYFAHETPPARIARIGSGSDVGTKKFNASTEMYLNNNFREDSPSVVAHRSCIEIFRSGFGVWNLTYNPSESLNQYYNQVFDSGCVSYFHRK